VTVRRARVLHVITRLIRGGADENTVLTVNGLPRDRFRVALAVGPESDEAMLGRVASDVEVVRVPDLVRDVHPARDLRALGQLRSLCARARVDVFHTHVAKAGILGRAAADGRVGTVVHTIHGATFHGHQGPLARMLYRALERRAARAADRLIVVGEDLRARYLAAGVGRPEQYVTIRSGMDVEPFRRAAALAPGARVALRRAFGIPEDAFVVTSAARLEPRKGQAFLLEAGRALAQRFTRVRFLMAGEGPERAALERLAAAHPALRGRVVFPGYCEDLAPVLGLSDAFCLTSLWEGLPRVLVQASLAGLPVVTFGVEGAAEVVRNGESGWIVAPRDVPGLTRALETLVWDPAKARAMGRRGADLVADEWDARRMVTRIAAVYDELLARRAVPALSALEGVRTCGGS